MSPEPNANKLITYIGLRHKDHEIRSRADALRMGDAFAAAILVSARNAPNFQSIITSLASTYEGYMIYSAITEYTAHKLIRDRAKFLEGDLKDKFEGTINRVALYAEQFAAIERGQEEEIARIGGAVNTAKLSVDELKADVSATFDHLKTFKNTLEEEIRFDTARLSWETRYKEARFGFWASIVLIIVFAAATFGVAYRYAIPFIEALSSLEVKTASDSISVALAHQFGRLLVFSVPVIVYLWVFRALMRFFMRSMLLMDDARQRQTMLDTYFLLSEKGRADERDRPMILWSLFRQTPGHGSDGIEPPDFTEVINAGLKRMGDKG